MEFSAEQRRAVDIEKARQDTCVVAGPGSGKTRVLVRFYERLVIEANVHPDRLLAITFTEKAARNMKERWSGRSSRLTFRPFTASAHGCCGRMPLRLASIRISRCWTRAAPQFSSSRQPSI